MKIKLMRFLDRNVGRVIIWLLLVVQQGLSLFRTRECLVKKSPTILLQKYFGLGSIVNSFPLIDELRRAYPEAEIVFLTFVENRQLLNITNKVHRVLTVRSDNLLHFCVDCLVVQRELWRIGIDISIDLEFFSRFSMIMSFVSRSPVRVGFFAYYDIRSKLLTHSTGFNHYKHISRAFLAMIEQLGVMVEDEICGVSLPSLCSEQSSFLNEIFGEYGNRPVVVVNPNASTLCELRKWPVERYAEVISRLVKSFPGVVCVLIGANGEQSYVAEVAKASGVGENVLNLAGKTNFRQLLALLEHAELLISNDSGPVHLAAAYQTNTVVLFGPETPVLYRPLNVNARVIYHGIYCSPCLNVLDNKSFENCQTVCCLIHVSVDEVYSEIADILSSKST